MSEEYSKQLNVTLQYPHSDEFEYFTKINVIDLDLEAEKDIMSGDGFLIAAPKSSNKKDMKNIDGIYSSRFGQKLGDVSPYANRYSCSCGATQSRVMNNTECPMCHTKVKYVDDNYKMFGWIQLKKDYHILNPKFYDSLDYIFGESKFSEERKKMPKGGRKLKNILNYSPEVDQHGFLTECNFKPDKEPYYGMGMLDFYDRFDEVLDFYYSLNPKKKDYYDEIQDYRYACKCRHTIGYFNQGTTCPECGSKVEFVDKDIIFTHSIPVFTTHLRPADIKDGYMYFEPTNAMYNMINTHVHRINNDKRKMNKDPKVKNSELFKVQMQYMDLTNEIMNILNGKKGQLRGLVGGRYNYSVRAVIRQDASLRCDQIKLPYVALVKLLQQQIVNILVRNYNISPSEANIRWEKAVAKKDDRVAEIIDNLIKASGTGLPFIINRNPTINYGSIMQMFCIGYTDTLTMSVPLQCLKSLAADFDGDVLNILLLINKAFYQRAYEIFNPRNAMYISRIDGRLNSDLLIQRDTLINTNTFLYLGRDKYSSENIAKIESIRARQKQYYDTGIIS